MLKNLLTTSFAILILFSCLKSEVTDQLITPPIKLMTDLAQFFHSRSIILHSCVDRMMPEIVEITKQINKQGYYFVFSNVQENFTIDVENVDLHIVVIDHSQSLSFFINYIKYRKKCNKESWILYSKSMVKDVMPNLEIAALDLDDEIFLASAQKFKTYLVEVYKIGPFSPIEINDVGTWSEIDDIEYTTQTKWYRRRNLKVLMFS